MGASKRGGAKVAAVGALPQQPQQDMKKTPGSIGAGSANDPHSRLTSQLRKTKICMYHLRGNCQYGENCAFAHSCTELQSTPDLRKTRLCQAFEAGNCNSKDCTFAHGEEELRSTNLFYKKTLCIWNQRGKCRNGDQCRFAHGTAELRAELRAAADRMTKNAFMDALAQQEAMKTPANGLQPAPGLQPATGQGANLSKEPMKVLPGGFVPLPPAPLQPEVMLPSEAMDMHQPKPLPVSRPPAPVRPLPTESMDVPLGMPDPSAWYPMNRRYMAPNMLMQGLPTHNAGDLSADLDRLHQQKMLMQGVRGLSTGDFSADLDRLHQQKLLMHGLSSLSTCDLSADLDRLHQSIAKKDIEANLEKLREAVMSLTQKCNQLRQNCFQSAPDPTFSGMGMMTDPGLMTPVGGDPRIYQ